MHDTCRSMFKLKRMRDINKEGRNYNGRIPGSRQSMQSSIFSQTLLS